MKLIICILVLTSAVMADSNVDQLLKKGNDEFTAKMFQEVVKKQAGKSVVISAFSVLSPLSQLALASVGPSHDEILNVIGMPNDNVTKDAMVSLNTKLSSVKGVELKQANKMFVREGFELNDEFATVSKDIFNSELQNLDFSNQDSSAKEINDWVEDHTNKRIKNLVTPGSITSNTVAFLVNAIYFKGMWKEPFLKFKTRDRDFYVDKNKKVVIPMMHNYISFKYGVSSELDAKFLEMPYVGDKTSFVVVLPNKVDGIDTLIEKLKDPAVFTRGVETMSYNDVDVALPKFKIETTTNLKEALEKMNLKKMFDSRTARMENLLKGAGNLYVSDATQKAFIEVNEEGAEAAASNAFSIHLDSLIMPLEPLEFIADHPFVFYLMYNDIILFNGVYRA